MRPSLAGRPLPPAGAEAPPAGGTPRAGFPRVSWQHRAEYAALRTVAFLVRRLPIDTAGRAMGALFAAVMPLTSKQRTALRHLAHAMPHLGDRERRRITRRMWRHLGAVAAEAMLIDRLAADASRLTLPPDFEALARRTEGGAVAVTAHFGNWELAGLPFVLAGRRGAGVYKALHNPLSDRWVRTLRARLYEAGLHAKGPRLGLHLLHLLDEGVGIGLVADVRERRGVTVRFFGHEATATPLPAMLARRTGRPLLAGVVRRTRSSRFTLELIEIAVPVTDDRDADIRAATQAYHDAFERWIRAEPHQWLWTHRKWVLPSQNH